jgi:hypothetical protein
MVATLVRVLIVCAFASALAVHLHRRSPGAPQEAALPFAAHAGERLRYLVLADAGDGRAAIAADAAPAHGGALGSLAWRCGDSADHRGGQDILELRIHDLMRIPAVAAAARLLPQAPPPGLELVLTITSQHAEDGRLSAARAELAAGGGALASAGIGFDALATSVTWRWPNGLGAREFPPLPPLIALAAVTVLPAHLRPGARAALTLPSIDPATWTPAFKRDVLVAQEPEEVGTISGVQALLRVDELSGTRRIASFWCDDGGLVWRARWDDLGLALELAARSVAPK